MFGSESFSAVELDVSALDGTNGFKIEGTDAGDFAGTAVAGAGVSGEWRIGVVGLCWPSLPLSLPLPPLLPLLPLTSMVPNDLQWFMNMYGSLTPC